MQMIPAKGIGEEDVTILASAVTHVLADTDSGGVVVGLVSGKTLNIKTPYETFVRQWANATS